MVFHQVGGSDDTKKFLAASAMLGDKKKTDVPIMFLFLEQDWVDFVYPFCFPNKQKLFIEMIVNGEEFIHFGYLGLRVKRYGFVHAVIIKKAIPGKYSDHASIFIQNRKMR